MGSLRARLLAGVLVLAAAGLVTMGAVTYAEQRSFLQGRVDQQVIAARGAVSQALDRAGFGPSAGFDRSSGRFGPGGIGPPPLNLPPGTYGQRRDAEGKALGAVTFTFGQSAPPAPRLPKTVGLGAIFTVGSVGSTGLRYRVLATRDLEDSGITIVAVPLREVEQTLNRLLLVEGIVIAGILVALGALAFLVVRLGLAPLYRIERTAGEIAAGDLSRRVSPADSRTEVGRLGLALNAMLARLEQAFADRTASEERLRTFLADASHELRTPLASIRGYAELHRMGATKDTELAMRRIEEESARMGVLVEDLLTLARLDETPRREPIEVDLAALAADAVADARASAPDRAISLHAPDHATVSGEPRQLHQVLANLLGNALVHTPAGSPVEVAVAAGEDTVELSVRDHGPGVPAGAREHLFERFWRAEGGRERGRGGAGLGLAIVQAIVLAHRGEVFVRDAPGGGALFVMRLPAAGALSELVDQA